METVGSSWEVGLVGSVFVCEREREGGWVSEPEVKREKKGASEKMRVDVWDRGWLGMRELEV